MFKLVIFIYLAFGILAETQASLLPKIQWPSHVALTDRLAQRIMIHQMPVEIQLFEVQDSLSHFVHLLSPQLPKPSFFQVIPEGLRISGLVDQHTHWVLTLTQVGAWLRGQFSALRLHPDDLSLPSWLLPQGLVVHQSEFSEKNGSYVTWIVKYALPYHRLQTLLTAHLVRLGWTSNPKESLGDSQWHQGTRTLSLRFDDLVNESIVYAQYID